VAAAQLLYSKLSETNGGTRVELNATRGE